MTGGDDHGGFDVLRAADIRFLIERNADGILVLDTDGAVLFANPAAEEAFGRPARELVGSEIGVPAAAGETTEIAILRPGGSQIDAEMRVVATTWENRPAFLVSLRDVSARKAMEDRMRQAQKMEAIGRLTAGVAHDFNNLLTVIMGNLATVQRELEGGAGTPRVARAAENAMEGARRAATLTHRLLAFSRRQTLEPKPIDVNKLILGMSDLLRRTLGESVEIETALCDGPLRTEVDPNQLETAILNLAVNARDAMPDGGRLVLETRHSTLAAEADDPPGTYVEICVRDTGVGMSPETQAQAFEPFFTTKDVGRGTGLGLSQVFGFVKQSGGEVKLESAPGEGACVTLYLPWRSTPDVAQELEQAGTSAPGGVETILVVDDDEDVRAYCVETLRELGYRIVQAKDAASALQALSERADIQLLFTDVGLPGGTNGRELIDEARRRHPQLKALLTTAYPGAALVSSGRLEPGLQLLSKPYTYAALAEKVRTVLDSDRAKPLRVLVVEDEVLVRLTIVETLIDAGCRVEEAETASQAVAKFRELGEELDAAIVDIGLPDGRGDRLIDLFRAVRADMPILLSTGYHDRPVANVDDDERLGLLEKPFDGATLRSALRALNIGRT